MHLSQWRSDIRVALSRKGEFRLGNLAELDSQVSRVLFEDSDDETRIILSIAASSLQLLGSAVKGPDDVHNVLFSLSTQR